MAYSEQTMNIVNAIKSLSPDVVAQDRLNIVVHQDAQNGKEYIALWVNSEVEDNA